MVQWKTCLMLRMFFFQGESLGKLKNGTIIRSKDDESESFALVCPCKVCSSIYSEADMKIVSGSEVASA